MSKIPENQSTVVPIYLKGKLLENMDYKVGYWDNGRKVWGLLHLDYPTHMCYGFDYCEPQEAIESVRGKHPDFPWWSFDVGAELYVKLDDLEKAFKKLGFWRN